MRTPAEVQHLANAYRNGRVAFEAGLSESDRPFVAGSPMADEWLRGYRVARKQARFDATIAKRRGRSHFAEKRTPRASGPATSER